MKHTNRKLKISWIYRKRIGMFDRIFPKLVLSGKWFQDAGFQPGDQTNVTVSHDCIIIKKEVQK